MITNMKFAVTGQRIELTEPVMLVAETVHIYTASFVFNSTWDGYTKTAVFRGGDVEREQLLTDDSCEVPWEVLLPGAYLKVGVYGTKVGSRLPTIWTSHRQYIHDGAGPTDEAADPSPVLAEQILQRMGDLGELKTEDKSSLVAAINEVRETGVGGTADHSKLKNRDAADQHPIGAITGLKEALDDKQPAGDYLTQETDPTVPSWAKAAQKPPYTASEVGADPYGTADAKVAAHNTGADAHSDIRLLISGLTDRLNALADSDDTTLDQLSEVVAYIKSNRTLIESITTNKVSVSDIIDNLTTNVSNKPLSAAQGVALKAMINAITVPAIDNTLTKSGAAADAKAVGDAISSLSEEIANLPSGGTGLTSAEKTAMLTLFKAAAYTANVSGTITSLETLWGGGGESGGGESGGGETGTTYSITNNLTNVTNSNSAISASDGTTYSATLTAADGYVLDSVTVTMGGLDVTDSVYVNGTITIPAVTGNVVITASAVVEKTEELPFVSGQTYTVGDFEVTEGHIFSANGTITENNGFSYAVFPCRGANRVIFNSSIYINFGVLMLDANKTYLRTVGTTQTSGLFTSDGMTTCEVSRDAEYIMFQCRATNMPNITVTLYQDPEYNGAYELNTWYRIPWRDGYSVNINTGVIAENANAMCSDYMSIYGATTLQITNGLRHFHVFYDADKNYLSTVTVQSTAPVSYGIPEGATYLVILPPSSAQHHNQSIRITA